MATYDEILEKAQSTMHTVLSGDTNLMAHSPKILDGVPEKLLQGTGFPYIIVPTPRIAEINHRYRKHHIEVIFNIEVWDKRESNIRTLGDHIRKAINDRASTMSAEGFSRPNVNSASREFTVLPDNTVVYTGTITARFMWDES